MSNSRNEAFSRILLIDKALEYSGWNLLNPQQIQFEFHTANGRADYLLKDRLGRVLCVLEAKREDVDPYVNMYHFCCNYPGIRHGGTPTRAKRVLAPRDATFASLFYCASLAISLLW